MVAARDCPLCHSMRNTVFMKEDARNNRDHVQLLKCTDCGFVYSKLATIDYTDYGKAASKKSDAELENALISQNIHRLVAEIINKTSVKNGSVLDFGCGVGLMLRGFKERNYDVLGVEESAAYRDMLAESSIPAARLEDIDHLRESFDIVILKDVLEHLENPLQVLDKIISFIKPGGYFYIRVPNRYAYPFHWAVDTKGHINHFTPGILKKILGGMGLSLKGDVKVYDISSRAGRLYNLVFWKLRYLLPMTHQISLLYKKV